MKASGTEAASSKERCSGIAIASRTSISAYSEKAPGQRPITRWPMRHPVTPAPKSAISPAHSMPMGFTLPALARPWPTMNSPRLRPAARTFTSNWCGPTSGRGASTSSMTPWSAVAFMV